MAELAIPIIALGSLYIMSQSEKNKKTENYTNLNKKKITSDYPTSKPVGDDNNINYYPNANQSTDKYFSETKFDANINTSSQNEVANVTNISSLTGNPVKQNEFKHNNMVPFFGAKITGAGADYNIAETRLDNLQGLGSQYFKKQETAPLFQPEKNIHFTHGTPDSNDFYLSRQNPSMNMANTKPWDAEQVGPGLNKGYTTKGSDGFNAGMESRNSWLPKTVDELRVETNPKLTFGLNGHQGPALAPISNVGIEGRVEKYHPDTYYDNNPDRWFTTTGLEKGERNRGEEILKEMKANCPQEYFGDAKDGDATYIRGEYEDTRRQQLQSEALQHAYNPSASGKKHDHGRGGYNILPNNRNTTANHETGPLQSLVQATVAPLLDILKPTRKENVIGNLRKNGNVNNNTAGPYVNNPNDLTKVTNRQMTENKVDLNHLNVQAGSRDGYLVSKQREQHGQRPSTNHKHLLGVGGNANERGEISLEAVMNQRNNCNKQQNSVVKPGNMDLFNGNQNLVNIRDDTTRSNNRLWVQHSGPSQITSVEQLGYTENIQTLSDKTNRARMEPDILSAFKNNPYVQSLNSAPSM